MAVCTYNRAANLPVLIDSLRGQRCHLPFELLFINNNSSDDTEEVLARKAAEPGPPLRYVTETKQGVAHARNRALEEAQESDYLLFMDDDELPADEYLLEAALQGLCKEGARCVGGKVVVSLGEKRRPRWLTGELLGFYGETDYIEQAFWIRDDSTPIWTGIIAYDMALFREHPELRFDVRYNREGKAIGGGEDAVMFRQLLAMGVPMRYLPKMCVVHHVEPWRINRRYFFKLHYLSGMKKGLHEMDVVGRMFLGAPLFLYRQLVVQGGRFFAAIARGDRNYVRQGMNLAHAAGMIVGYRKRKKMC